MSFYKILSQNEKKIKKVLKIVLTISKCDDIIYHVMR